jgi:hypothetical protein
MPQDPNKNKTIHEEAGLDPEQWQPANGLPIIPGVNNAVGAPPSVANAKDPYNSGPLPPNFGLSPRLVKTGFGGGVAEFDLMPIEGGPGVNAKSAGIATRIVNQAIANIPPTPPATTVATDQVVHGNALWEHDSAYFEMRDDFFPGSGNTPGPAAISTTVSSSVTGWFASGTPSESSYLMGAPPNLGQAYWANSGTKNQVMTMWPGPVGSRMSAGQRMTGFFPLLDYPSWQATFVFKFDGVPNGSSTGAFGTSDCTFYVGLTGDFLPASQTRPNTFIGLRFDTDTNAPSIADSFFTLEIVNNLQTSASFVRNNTQGTTMVTNVAPVEGVWHRLDITCTIAGTVTITLDGSSTNTLTGAMPQTLISDPAGDAAASSTNKGANITWSNAHGEPNFANGSKITIAGIADVGYTFLNGNWVTFFATNSPGIEFLTSASIGNGTLSAHAWTLTGLPGLMPFMTGGNDNTGVSPTSGAIGFFLDFFSLIWNPGVNTSNSLTPNPALPRYW